MEQRNDKLSLADLLDERDLLRNMEPQTDIIRRDLAAIQLLIDVRRNKYPVRSLTDSERRLADNFLARQFGMPEDMAKQPNIRISANDNTL